MKKLLTVGAFALTLGVSACQEPEIVYVCENGDRINGPCFYTQDPRNLENMIPGVTNLVVSPEGNAPQ